MDRRREAFGYYPLVHALLLGVCGAFLTGDLFNLYVWFEVMLMASFVLLALGGERAQLHGAIKYVTLNLVSSAVFLAAVGILYGVTGTLNMADLARKLRRDRRTRRSVTAVAMLFLVAFGIKAAVFPLFFWLPASYHTPPGAVSALFAGLLTKVGVYALIRVFTLLFVRDVGYTHMLILVLSGLTMVTGVLGAVAQREFRRVLSFLIIGQIGYMIMGLGLFTPAGLAGPIFYIVDHVVVMTNLFLVTSVVRRLCGTSSWPSSAGCTGPTRAWPALPGPGPVPGRDAAAVRVLRQAGADAGRACGRAVRDRRRGARGQPADPARRHEDLGGGVLEAGARPRPSPELVRPLTALLVLPIGVLAVLTVAIGLAAEPVFVLARGRRSSCSTGRSTSASCSEDRHERVPVEHPAGPGVGAMTGRFTLPNLALGFVLGYLILVFSQRVLGSSPYFAKGAQVVRFALFFVWELVLANLRVAYDVVTPGYHMRPAIVAVPLDAKTDAEITLLANLITLTPGSFSLDVSADRSVLYVHAMYIDDPEAFRRAIKDGFERRVLELLR